MTDAVVDEVLKHFNEHHKETKDSLANLAETVRGLKAETRDIYQKLSRDPGDGAGFGGAAGGQGKFKTIGDEVVASDEFKDFVAKFKSSPSTMRLDLEEKAITIGGASSGAPFNDPNRIGTNGLPMRRMTVRDLLPSVRVDSNTVEYVSQTGRTNNAAPVAENATKPESDLAFELRTVTTRTLAHFITASTQVLSDVPQLLNKINEELLYGLALVEENQLLSGAGTGQNLTGLVPAATAYSAPITISSPNSIDLVGLAMLQSALAEYPASGVVMHPSDWMFMRLLKDSQGRYLLGDPQAQVTPSLFGVPVVTTQAMTIDKFLVGDFRSAATILDRWTPRIEMSNSHADYFATNRVAIRAEERLAQAIENGAALIYGDFGRVP